MMPDVRSPSGRLASLAVLTALFGSSGVATADGGDRDWRQWGGPSGTFQASAPPLQPSWTGEGPLELFRVALEGGHSAVSVAEDQIFVLHGRNREEHLLALSLSGKRLWEQQYTSAYGASIASHDGPHAAPLIFGDTVVTVAMDATVRAWRRADGELVWIRDLRNDHGVTLPQAGYAASPLLVGGKLLLPGLGGDGPGLSRTEKPGLGVLCLDASTGATLWTRHAFPSSHASAVLAPSGDVALFHGMEELVAVRVEDGERLWTFPVRNGAADNVSFTPLWDEDNAQWLLSHAYDRYGAQALRVDPGGGSPQRAWSNSRLKVEHGNGLLWNGMFLASDGSAPAFLVALDTASGELLWKHRLPKANLLGVEDQFVLVLDGEGTLHLTKPTREGPGIVSSFEVLGPLSWTAPTLVGRTLFLRDPDTLVALRLP